MTIKINVRAPGLALSKSTSSLRLLRNKHCLTCYRLIFPTRDPGTKFYVHKKGKDHILALTLALREILSFATYRSFSCPPLPDGLMDTAPDPNRTQQRVRKKSGINIEQCRRSPSCLPRSFWSLYSHHTTSVWINKFTMKKIIDLRQIIC